MKNLLKKISIYLIFFLSFTEIASAEALSAEGQYIFNSLAFYIGGVLVAFMAKRQILVVETGTASSKKSKRSASCSRGLG